MFKKAIICIFLFFLLFSCAAALEAAQEEHPEHTLIVFYSSSCHKCIQINELIMPDIEKEFRGKLRVEYRDTAELENYKMMLSLKDHHGLKGPAEVPLFYLEGRFLNSKGNVRERLRWFINDAFSRNPLGRIHLPRIDLNSRLLSFRPLAVAGAGLLDGINPCAFTVIVFFVSYLTLQRYRRREIAVVGLSFICAVFLSYILIGSGLFGFLYRIKGFWLISKAINILIGALCILLGCFALYDLYVYLRTRRTEGLLLQLPQGLKNRIHAIIGKFHRREPSSSTAPSAKGLAGLVASALVSGFLVSIVEAACTGQVYLPTIAFILKTSGLKLRAFFYIVLYNIMFVIPLLAVFLFALLGVSSAQFAAYLKKHLAAIKIAMALFFFVLGGWLVYFELPAYYAAGQPARSYETEWDFGTIKEKSSVTHDFYLRNEAFTPLKIREVASSCGCAVSSVGKRLLQTGETTRIRVRFDSTGYRGPTQQYIYVHTDDNENPVRRFIIKADVVKE